MLPDIGGLELLVIAVVALIVVGPKDLPQLLRKVGAFVSKLRGMASDFRTSFEDMAHQSELDDLRKQVDALRRGELDTLVGETRETLTEIETSMVEVGAQLDAPTQSYMPPPYDHYAEDAVEPAPARVARKPRAKPAASEPPAGPKATRPKAAKAPPRKAAPKTGKTA